MTTCPDCDGLGEIEPIHDSRVAAPVRLTDEDFARLYDEAEFDLDLHEMREAAEHMFNAIQSAVLRANGFKVDE